MRLAREGYSIVLCTFAVFAAVAVGMAFAVKYAGMPVWLFWAVAVLLFGLCVCVALFFREPTRREYRSDPDTVFSSADGKVVVIEEVFEGEYLKERCLQLSVFMSITNVHMNWVPVGGEVEYFKYHPGRFLVAWHPKSSTENERTTTVVRMPSGQKVLFRQIAGLIARRIISYMTVGHQVEQNSVCGFIKFGSRVDVLVPKDSELLVEIGDPTVGSQTPIARLRKNLENE